MAQVLTAVWFGKFSVASLSLKVLLGGGESDTPKAGSSVCVYFIYLQSKHIPIRYVGE